MPDNCTKYNQNVPAWINESYFEKMLNKRMPHFVKILKFVIIPATPSAEKSSSIMLRIKMEIELEDGFTQRKSYIMKIMLDSGESDNFANTLNLFPKERLMYESIIPQLENLYAERGYNVKFAPTFQWIENISGQMALVLEDLQARKYRNVNRQKGFDVIHMKCILEKLAEFHAASVILRERLGPLPKQFRNSFLPANYHKSKSYQARVSSYKEAMASWGLDDYEEYAKCIPNAEQYVNAKMKCFHGEPDEFKVLNHGDFWSSNIMVNYAHNHRFTKNSSGINQIRFVDFQMCKWATPALDLWQIIICSARENYRARYFNFYLQVYHNHLVRTLNFLKFTKLIPTLEDLTHTMIKYGFWGYFATFNHLVLILLPPEERLNLSKLLQPGEEGDRIRKKAFTNPMYVKAVKEILPFFHRKGILDFASN